jgi:hypothetical protein
MSEFAHHAVQSWDDFCDLVSRLPSEGPPQQTCGWVFRGQSKDWRLASALERALINWDIPLPEAASIELQTIREFRRRTREPEHHRVHEDTLYCLALMQHHGAPTRLLDSTYSPFVAATFALQDGINEHSPVVWCFRGEWGEQEATPQAISALRSLDEHRNDATFKKVYQLQNPGVPPDHPRQRFVKPENPFYLNERLTAQQGVFLCPADIESTFVENLQSMAGWDRADNIVKLVFELSKKEALQFVHELRNMNLSFATLFRGLDGFSKSIGQQIIHYYDLAEGRAGISRNEDAR